MKSYLMIAMFLPVLLIAGETEQTNIIPYNSKGNVVALSVENTSKLTAKGVSVEIQNVPKWIRFDSTKVQLSSIATKKSKQAEFTFSVDRSAPVDKEQKIKALVKTADGQKWTTEISMTISAPKEYHLYQNFPNPFNPSTTIAIDLPKQTKMKIIIYNILGRIVKQLSDETKEAGYAEFSWDGRNDHGSMVASGMYFYQVMAGSYHAVKKMVMMK